MPAGAESYDIDWAVEAGAVVAEGQPLAWLCAAGGCALTPLAAPCPGVVSARWSGLLRTVRPGELVAVIDGEPAACVSEERARLRVRVEELSAELAEVRARRERKGAGAVLLAHDEQRLTRWLAEARARYQATS